MIINLSNSQTRINIRFRGEQNVVQIEDRELLTQFSYR